MRACASQSGSATRRRATRKPSAAIGLGAIVAGVAFESGWPEIGSTDACVSAPTRARPAVAAVQWIGANSEPATLARRRDDPQLRLAVRRRHPREAAVAEAQSRGVVGMDLDERRLAMARQARRQAGARHRVPLVAHPAGVEDEAERFGQARRHGSSTATKRARPSG